MMNIQKMPPISFFSFIHIPEQTIIIIIIIIIIIRIKNRPCYLSKSNFIPLFSLQPTTKNNSIIVIKKSRTPIVRLLFFKPAISSSIFLSLRSNPGIITPALAHIGGSTHVKNWQAFPPPLSFLVEHVQKWLPGLLSVQEVFSTAVLPQ
ncbi:hypothetical protein CDL12_11163 [Handroanthus impetiginosus]|uniref:Uncharacterized protein n=1 Tax=Handroanthus impetiginosus TaxID=429701 RepID=A0A2G9HFH3_9LAMI|nr:hypothetical protein CDL12_11163 [Handroanthus impetiginosus]